MKDYQVVGGMFFDPRTPKEVCDLLSYYNSANPEPRVRLFYGDPETGRYWLNEYDVMGYIGRSTGPIKIPLLIHRRASDGGPSILDHCIMRITRDRQVVYENPKFFIPTFEIEDCRVIVDGDLYAVCDTPLKARRLVSFLMGDRNTK